MKISQFLQLIRFKNLMMLVCMQVLFSMHFFKSNLNLVELVLLITATVFLAGAGNIINDYFDVTADTINKPNKVIVGKLISKKTTLKLYIFFNLIGLITGFILAILTHKMYYSLLFIGIFVLLYLYSLKFKAIALLGNFIVSLLIGFSILILVVFPPTNDSVLPLYFDTLIYIYAGFAFTINFIREIVKDIEDVNGDYNVQLKTLPIIIGKKRTQHFIFYLTSLPFMALIILMSNNRLLLFQIYVVIFILLPLGYFMYKIKEVKTTKQLHTLSNLLKLILLFGVLSILF
ncbi:MAG: geranylgeranylglycerol-phosphate geranylgeranyltransferase [Flavobacteriaceae bacterium]